MGFQEISVLARRMPTLTDFQHFELDDSIVEFANDERKFPLKISCQLGPMALYTKS